MRPILTCLMQQTPSKGAIHSGEQVPGGLNSEKSPRASGGEHLAPQSSTALAVSTRLSATCLVQQSLAAKLPKALVTKCQVASALANCQGLQREQRLQRQTLQRALDLCEKSSSPDERCDAPVSWRFFLGPLHQPVPTITCCQQPVEAVQATVHHLVEFQMHCQHGYGCCSEPLLKHWSCTPNASCTSTELMCNCLFRKDNAGMSWRHGMHGC